MPLKPQVSFVRKKTLKKVISLPRINIQKKPPIPKLMPFAYYVNMPKRHDSNSPKTRKYRKLVYADSNVLFNIPKSSFVHKYVQNQHIEIFDEKDFDYKESIH